MAVSEVTTKAELVTSEFIPDLWSLKVQSFLEDAFVIVPLVDHTYEPDLTYGITLHIPNYVEITATSVSSPGTEITPKEAEGATLEITVDKWYEAPISYSEFSRDQNRPDFLEKASKGSAYAVAKQIDKSLADEFKNFQGGTKQGTDGNTVTDDLLIDCMEIIDEYSVRQEDRAIVGDPSMKADLMKIDKFIRNDYGKGNVVASGKFGDIYNCSVWITNNLEAVSPGSYAAMFQKEALAIIMQKQISVSAFDMPQNHMHLIMVQAIWGTAEMRDRAGVAFFTRKS